MTAPTIRLATSEDMRSITSQNLDDIKRLPFLYIVTDDPAICKRWVDSPSQTRCSNSSRSEVESAHCQSRVH